MLENKLRIEINKKYNDIYMVDSEGFGAGNNGIDFNSLARTFVNYLNDQYLKYRYAFEIEEVNE